MNPDEKGNVELTDKLFKGDVRSLARAITLVEAGLPGADLLMREVFRRTGRATVIGLTGSPGSGKSSLVDQLVGALRASKKRVGVVAIDPSSAFSGSRHEPGRSGRPPPVSSRT